MAHETSDHQLKITSSNSSVDDILLFAGGNGFLGQHIIKLLHECDPLVKEIRVLDLKPYENKLGKSKDRVAVDGHFRCDYLLVYKVTVNGQENGKFNDDENKRNTRIEFIKDQGKITEGLKIKNRGF